MGGFGGGRGDGDVNRRLDELEKKIDNLIREFERARGDRGGDRQPEPRRRGGSPDNAAPGDPARPPALPSVPASPRRTREADETGEPARPPALPNVPAPPRRTREADDTKTPVRTAESPAR
jgi:hypothetical protein